MKLKLETDKPTVNKTIVVYSGRFQPFHKGHYIAYRKLVSKFGKDNVYIATSNVTDTTRSPFTFEEKKKIATKLFGIPSDKFIQIKNPYAPKEILDKYDGATTQYIAAVGEKDATRLTGKYFKPYKGKAGYGYDEIGYTYAVPSEQNPISGTNVRTNFKGADDKKSMDFFKKIYPKFDNEIYQMVKNKLNEVGTGFPTGMAGTFDKLNTIDVDDENIEEMLNTTVLYDPIAEIINRVITENDFEEFISEYLNEKPEDAPKNPIYDKELTYTAKDGQKKKIKVRSALRLPKDHEAHIQAKKLTKGIIQPIKSEPKKQETPPQKGQPVQKGQTQQGKVDRPAADGSSDTTQTPPPQTLKGVELKSSAEHSKDKEKVKDSLMNMVKSLDKKDREFISKGEHKPGSEARKSMSSNIASGLNKFGNGIKNWAGHKKEMIKGTGEAVWALANGKKLGSSKNKQTGKWDYSDEKRKEQIHHLKHFAKDTALILGSMALGGAGVAAVQAALGGATAGGVASAAGSGAIGVFTHGIGGFGGHLAKDIAKHAVLETLGMSATKAAAGGAGLATASMGLFEVANGNDFVSNVMQKVAKKMETYELSDVQLKQAVVDYKKEKEKGDLGSLFGTMNENLSPSKSKNIQHFIEYATKRLKLNEKPNVVLLKDNELGGEQPSLGGYSPLTGEIFVVTDGRLTADILRTIAHEMVHRKQDELKLIRSEDDSGKTGSPIENQANALAGVLLRDYGKINKQIYNEVSNVQSSNTADVPDGAFIKKNKKRKLDGDKGEAWYSNGGYTQTDFPKADAIFGDDAAEERTVKYTIKNLPNVEYVETDFFKEDINIDVDKGDTVLMGKFKNKKTTVKDIGTDDYGMPTINGKKAATFRLPKGEKRNPQSVFEAEVPSTSEDESDMIICDNCGHDWYKSEGGNAMYICHVCGHDNQPSNNTKQSDTSSELDEKVSISNLNSIEKYADSQLSPEDIEFTKHFFDRVNDPRNGKEISDAELTGFFKRLAKHKKEFTDFINKYKEIVVTDRRSDINIPFVKSANKVIAKTIMRKADFKSSTPKMVNEELKWQASTLEMCMNDMVPLTLPIVKQLVEIRRTNAFHITDIDNLSKLVSLEGKSKSISAFNKVDSAAGPASGKGMWTKGGILVLLSGIVLAESISDLWSKPDKSGIRWITPGNAIHNEFSKKNKIIDFAPQLKPLKEKWEQSKSDLTNQEKQYFIKTYIDTAYKLMIANKQYFQNKYLNSDYLYYNSDWNEVILSKIKVEKIAVIQDSTEITGISPLKDYPKDVQEKYKELKQAHNQKVADFYLERQDNPNDKSKERIDAIKKKYKNVEIITSRDVPSFIKKNGGYIRESVNESLLLEGGAYGHMNHPFDISMNLTFGDLKKIINNALDGKLGVVKEKTDGQALAISWKKGRLIAARNKGHLANGGENALDMNALASKFAGRGELSDAYNFAMKDLSTAISGLSEKERQSIFKDGSAFCNLEVIYPENANVIPYGQSLLVLHNVVDYDDKGNAIGSVAGAEGKLAAMIKKINANVQSKYTIQGPPITKLPKDEKLSSQKGKFNGMLSALQSRFKLSDKDGIAEYHYAWWMKFVNDSKKNLTQLEKEGLARRWAFDNKSFGIKSITDEDAKKWADGVDKDAKDKIMKGNIRKFEDIFLGVGAEVLSFMSSVLTAQPDAALQSIKSSLESSISDIRSGGSEAQIKRLEKELARLNAIGGFDKLVPNEGLVFVYKGNVYKLTGTFAPLNQILGIFKFGR
jgi:hypothetical protein